MMGILFLVILIGIIYFVSTMINKVVNRKGKYSYSNRVIKIFVGYFVILCLCLLFDLIIPGKEVSDLKTVNTRDLDRENSAVYDAASKGKIEKIDPKFLMKKWKFTYHERQLSIGRADDPNFTTSIIVERKNTNDYEIEALYYYTRFTVNQMDVTKYVKPLQLQLTGEQLNLIKAQTELKFSEFANPFSVNQFIGGNTFNHGFGTYGGPSILYLRIPKDLQLADPSGQSDQPGLKIEYVK